MTNCWQFLPEDRPSFAQVVSWTENMLEKSGEYLDLSPSVVNNVTYLEPILFSGEESDEEVIKEEATECDVLVSGQNQITLV